MHTCLGLELGRAWEMKQALISSSVSNVCFKIHLRVKIEQPKMKPPSVASCYHSPFRPFPNDNKSAHLGPMASVVGCSGTFKMFPAWLCWENHLMIIIWKHEIHWDTFYTSKKSILIIGTFWSFLRVFYNLDVVAALGKDSYSLFGIG